jgi:uncharacterized membrane protein YccF (DUF307 family)
MTRSRDLRTDVARRTALENRLARLKVAAWAVVAGAWLALWALVSGAVAGTATTPSVPAVSGQENQAIDLFGQGSTLGVGSGTPVLRSNGS